jgi:DNA-binding transcriptional regulator YiaG
MKIKSIKAEELFNRHLTARQKKELRAIEARGGKGIDTSDIPEVKEIPRNVVRGKYSSLPPVNVGDVRKNTGLSQAVFARRYGFVLRTLQDWECGRVEPAAPVRAYLTVIAQFPKIVDKALRVASGS